MGDLMDTVGTDMVEETLNQLTGRSHKKWAVMLLAFVLGAVVAAFFIRKQLGAKGASVSDLVDDAADTVSDTISDATA